MHDSRCDWQRPCAHVQLENKFALCHGQCPTFSKHLDSTVYGRQDLRRFLLVFDRLKRLAASFRQEQLRAA
jgi:hypothetical protein